MSLTTILLIILILLGLGGGKFGWGGEGFRAA